MENQATMLDLPLFPLGTVLFPGMTLPLHIFEERYRRMIGQCLEGSRQFGIALLREGKEVGGRATPYDVGTVARIVKAVRMADGRYNLIARGAARFQVLESHYQFGYLTARVELLEEEAHDARQLAAAGSAVRSEFTAFIEDLATLIESKPEPIAFPDDPTALSYYIASQLPIYHGEKQRLLEASSTDLRLDEERRILVRERSLIRELGTIPAPYHFEDSSGPHLLAN